jgi:hypothetical protein
MSFKKIGDTMKTETVYCNCGGEFVNGKCDKCGKEVISKDANKEVTYPGPSMGCTCDQVKCKDCDNDKKN